VGIGQSIGTPPEHSKQEKIVSINQKSKSEALVETEFLEAYSKYYEYTMRKVGNDWRILKIQTFHCNSEERVKDVDLHSLRPKAAKAVPQTEVPSGLDELFARPLRLQTSSWGVVQTKIVAAGEVFIPSGYLAADDPGCWESGAAVLEQQLPPGRHKLELVIGVKPKIVAAARLNFGGKGAGVAFATRRIPGNHSQKNTHIIGVDGGMIGLADSKALGLLSRRDRERLYHQLCEALDKKRDAGSIALNSHTEAWAIRSGCGDGGYAAYWLLGKDKNPVSLIFDFAELALPVWETLHVPFVRKGAHIKITDSELRNRKISLKFTMEEGVQRLCVKSKRETVTKLFSPNNQLVFDSAGSGCSMSGDETFYLLPEDFSRCIEGKIELQIYMGHKYVGTK
jgi:hypothetical protein